MIRRLLRVAAAAMVASVAAACGGSSSPSSSPTSSTSTATSTTVASGAPRRLDATAAPWRLPAPVSRAVVLTDGKAILVYGGQDAQHTSTATALAVDPRSGAATTLGSLSPAVHDAAGVRLGSESVIIAGGSPPPRAVVQVVPTAGVARTRGQLPAARTDHVAATVGGTIDVLGGAQDEGLPIASVVASTDAGASWHDAGTLSQPARYPAVAVSRGAVYLFGGVTTANGTDTTAIQRYDPGSRTTTVIGHLPAPLSHATAVPFGGVVFVVGGYVNDVPSNQILRFDPATATVTAVGTLPAPITDAGATVVGGVGYLVGGEGPGRSTTAAVEVLTPR